MKMHQSLLSKKQKKSVATGAIVFATAFALLVIDDEVNSIRAGMTSAVRDTLKSKRKLSIDLGNGNCEWREPLKTVPDNLDFEKTLIAGFPSGDKRMVYAQMEALTGWPSVDEWSRVFDGKSNAPFIKTNYPHSAGTWSWDTDADQVVLVVQGLRRSLVEYSKIMWQTSEKNPWVEITVSVNALQTHLDHGDFIGKCQTFEYNPPPQQQLTGETVTVCHITNCDSKPYEELQVPSSTLQVHLDANTEDFVGECLAKPEYVTRSYSYNEKNRENVEDLFKEEEPESPPDDFFGWRDKHLLKEVWEWGWHIDFWMEDGLLRSPFTHEEACQQEFELYSCPKSIKSVNDKVSLCHRTASKKNPWIQLDVSQSAVQAHLDHGDFIGDCQQANDPDFVAPTPNFQRPDRRLADGDGTCVTHDPNCLKVTGGCKPKAVISADRLRSYDRGPAETAVIGNNLLSTKMATYVIDQSTWPCLWDKIIDKHEGPQSFAINQISGPNFSARMLESMIEEVTRVRDKYSQGSWATDDNAIRLVELVDDQLADLIIELGEVNSGARTIRATDILMPDERKNLSEFMASLA
ncbi:hypothetical protein ACHAWO_012829 [Cyclotella atomus]|uniref:Uncharacterized protein n=1 Tax=Cyclotella atomus TaxID=382360 RepID=A0ABD3MU90_9STRA